LTGAIREPHDGEDFASGRTMPNSLVVGRSLAVVCHPMLAWQRLTPSGRVALALAYAVFSYVAALATLLTLRG
jgi:hypothetical protein